MLRNIILVTRYPVYWLCTCVSNLSTFPSRRQYKTKAQTARSAFHGKHESHVQYILLDAVWNWTLRGHLQTNRMDLDTMPGGIEMLFTDARRNQLLFSRFYCKTVNFKKEELEFKIENEITKIKN